MEPKGKYLGTYEPSESKTLNWGARNWESIYIISKFIEVGVLILIASFVITHW